MAALDHQPVASTSKVPDPGHDAYSSPLPSSSAPSPGSQKAPPQAAHRLLWRGSLLSDTGAKLHGLAFVAHFPSGDRSPASTLTRPFAAMSQQPSSSASKAALDPFMSPDRQAQQEEREADSNLCLDLEVLRHGDLSIQRTVELAQPASLNSAANKRKRGSLKSRIESLKKGNDRVQLADTDPDSLYINVYVDPRCSTTKEWLERRFCDHAVDADGRTPKGLLVTLSDSEGSSAPPSSSIVIYGLLRSNDASTPKLQLRLGRKKRPPKVPIARPDDPLPRESLFAQKLRRTTSEPALSFEKGPSSKVSTTEKSNLMRTKSMANGVAHTSIATGRNPFAKARTQDDESSGSSRKRKESSAPPTPGRGRSGKRAKRSESFASLTDVAEVAEEDATGSPPPLPLQNGHVGEKIDWAERNKANIKKLVAGELSKRKVSKQDAEYKEIYSATSRGVGFALRKQAAQGEVSRQKMLALTTAHLKMYLPV